jgi:hypothetical protein
MKSRTSTSMFDECMVWYLRNKIIGLHLIYDNLNGQNYAEFLTDISSLQINWVFKKNDRFSRHWVGCGGNISWSPSSLVLIPSGVLLWRKLENTAYKDVLAMPGNIEHIICMDSILLCNT